MIGPLTRTVVDGGGPECALDILGVGRIVINSSLAPAKPSVALFALEGEWGLDNLGLELCRPAQPLA